MGKYFSIAELTYSSTAKQKGIDNTPPPAIKVKLEILITFLDKLREKYGKPIYITSGFRCPMLNNEVGGAATSQHTKGEAADLTVRSKEGNKALFELIRAELDFDQVIDENDFTWVHVSFKASGNRHEALRKTKKGYEKV